MKVKIIFFQIFTAFFLLLVSPFPLKAQDQNRATKESAFEQGKRAYQQALFEQAIRMMESSLVNPSESAMEDDARYYLYRSKLARDSAAIGSLVQDFIQKSNNRRYIKLAYVDWAEYALNKQQDRQAYKERMLEAIRYSGLPDEQGQWTMLLAHNESAQGNMQQAHRYLDKVSDQLPNTKWAPEAIYQAARWHLQAEQYEEAAIDLKKLRAAYPRHEHTRSIGIRLGESLYKSRQFESAIEEFQRVLPIAKGEDVHKAVYMVAESYNVLGDYDNASKWYLRYQREVDDAGLDSRAADYGLGWIYLKQQIYHWAVDAFNEAAVGEDELAQKATYYKAVSEKLSGRYADALSTFEQFFERFEEGIWAERVAYEWAVTAFEMGDYTKAIQVLLPLARKAERLDDPGKVLTFLGEAFFANGEYSSALQAFDVASKNGKLNPRVRRQAVFQKGWVLYRNQAYKDARSNFEEVYRAAAADTIAAEALFWSADCSFQLEDFDRAASEFRLFIENYPDHEFYGAAVYSLGWSHFMRADYEPAAEYLENFLTSYEAPPIAIFPYDTDTQLRLGDAWFALGRYEKAQSFYSKAIGAEPGGDYAMYQIANCFYRSEQTAKAIDEFAKLLRIYPYTQYREQARFNIGYLWFLNEQYDLAIEEYQKLIAMVPRSNWAARAQYSIGDALFNDGKYTESIEAYEKVLDDYPRSDYIIEAVTGIQNAQLANMDEDTSNEILRKFIEKNPRVSTLDALRYRKAESLFQSGDYQSALDAFEQYVRISSKDELKDDALFYVAESLRNLGQAIRAKEAYERLISRYPTSERSATAVAILAQQAFAGANYNESLRQYQKLEDFGLQYQQDSWIGQAESYAAMGNYQQAEAYFNQVLSIRPENSSAAIGLGILSLRNGDFLTADSLLAPVAEVDMTENGAKAMYYLALAKDAQQQRLEAQELLGKVNVLYGIYGEWVTRSGLKSIEWLLEEGKRGQAAEILQELKKIYPQSAYTQQAEQLINR